MTSETVQVDITLAELRAKIKAKADADGVAIWSKDDIVDDRCMFCGMKAIVELPPHLKKIQPDGTTHVCHPGFGGCNHGFVRRLEGT